MSVSSVEIPQVSEAHDMIIAPNAQSGWGRTPHGKQQPTERRNKPNAHADKLQNLVIAMHKTHMRKPSRDPDADQGRNDHLRQSQRGNRAPW